MNPTSICILIFLLALNILSASSSCSTWQVIVNKNNSHALEAAENAVVESFFTGSRTQSWQIQCSNKPGLFSIQNVQTGTYLDVDTTTKQVILTWGNGASQTQLWYINHDGHIVSTLYQQALKIDGTVGGFAKIDDLDPESTSQLFSLENN